MRSKELDAEPIGSVFIGGGTPTILSLRQMERLLLLVRESAHAREGIEFTVEANPNSLSPDMLSLLWNRGVNRVSIGVQSFSSGILQWLGRTHTAKEAERAVGFAGSTGFVNIGMDLIYGVPGQSEQLWKETLRRAAELRPAHISAYCLSLDEGSALHKEVLSGSIRLPEDGLIADQYEAAAGILEEAGYRHYEISNFCLPGFECRHNMNYWERGDYVGIGPGAWSFSGNRRTRNIADTEAYRAKLGHALMPVDFEEAPDAAQTAAETLFLGLRKAEGIDLGDYAERCGQEAKEGVLARVRGLSETGCFLIENGRLRLSRRGMMLSNEALSSVIP